MVRKIQENLRVIESSKTIFLLLVVLIAGAALPGAVFACDVTSVSFYLGRTQAIAESHNTSTVYIASGDSFWFHVHWGADTPDDQGFDLVIYDYSTSETLTTRSITSPTQRTYTGSTSLQTYSFVPHTIKAKVRRKPSGDWFRSSGRTLTVVEVDKLQYNDPDTGYTDISGTLYVHTGTTVTFKAIPNPSGASWPSGKPVWGGEASGTGSTKAVTFDTLSSSTSDYKTVWAECGNTVTANVIVYWFQGIPVPDIIFDGRTYDEYGVEETVFLAHTTYPGGITGLPLEWKVHNGVGSVSVSTYDAEAIPGDVDLKLEITSGPSKGRYVLYGKTVVAPANRFIRHRTETGIWHRKGQHSVVFRGESFLDPKNVSFTNIQRREGASTPAVGTGLFAPANGYIHTAGSWFTPSNPNITTGCYVTYDTTGFNFGLGGVLGENGTFSGYFIDYEYKGDDGVVRNMGNIESAKTVEAAGDSKAKKGSVGWVTAHLNDNDSNY